MRSVWAVPPPFSPMLGWIVVTGRPYYAVTDDKGGFGPENAPPGTHTGEVWHETLGQLSKEVQVKAGAETRVTFELPRK